MQNMSLLRASIGRWKIQTGRRDSEDVSLGRELPFLWERQYPAKKLSKRARKGDKSRKYNPRRPNRSSPPEVTLVKRLVPITVKGSRLVVKSLPTVKTTLKGMFRRMIHFVRGSNSLMSRSVVVAGGAGTALTRRKIYAYRLATVFKESWAWRMVEGIYTFCHRIVKGQCPNCGNHSGRLPYFSHSAHLTQQKRRVREYCHYLAAVSRSSQDPETVAYVHSRLRAVFNEYLGLLVESLNLKLNLFASFLPREISSVVRFTNVSQDVVRFVLALAGEVPPEKVTKSLMLRNLALLIVRNRIATDRGLLSVFCEMWLGDWRLMSLASLFQGEFLDMLQFFADCTSLPPVTIVRGILPSLTDWAPFYPDPRDWREYLPAGQQLERIYLIDHHFLKRLVDGLGVRERWYMPAFKARDCLRQFCSAGGHEVPQHLLASRLREIVDLSGASEGKPSISIRD